MEDLNASQYTSKVSSQWDQLINWEERSKSENDFFSKLLNKNNCKKVLDLAAGTGYHSIMLSKVGFNVTAIDASKAMIEKSKENAILHNVNIDFKQVNWLEIEKNIVQKFDAIICLGSSFPHLFNKIDRENVLIKLHSILNDNGILIIDHRNFDSLIAGKFSNKGKKYYCGESYQVNAELIDSNTAKFSYKSENSFFELSVYPLTIKELKNELLSCGFSESTIYGDFKPLTDIYKSDFIIHTSYKI